MEQKQQRKLRFEIPEMLDSLYERTEQPDIEKELKEQEREKGRQITRLITAKADEAVKNNTPREIFGYTVLGVIVGWLIFVAIVVSSYACKGVLSDPVLITLLSTTTLNVIGLLAIILNYFFPNRK